MIFIKQVILGLTAFIGLLSTSIAKDEYSVIEFEHQIYSNPYQSYKQLLKNQAVSETDKLWWLLRKAQCEYLLYFYQDFNKTIESLGQMINNQTPEIIQSYYLFYQGIIHRDKGKYKDSSEFLKKSLILSKKNGLDYIYLQAKNEQAYTQSLAENFEFSLTDLQEAYLKATKMEDQFMIATVYETYGAIYGYMDDYEKSLEYYQQAYEIYQSLGYKAHLAEAIYGLASTYRYMKNYDLAIKYFQKYREVSQFTPNEEISFFSAYGLGMTLSEKGDCQQAIEIIDQALQKKGVLDYFSELYKNKAICLIQTGQFEEAEKSLTQAKNIFDQLPDLEGTSWQLETIKIDSQLAHARGDYQKSYQLLDDYYLKYTTLLKKNSSDKLLDVRTRMEQERAKIEKDLESQKSQVATLKEKTIQQRHTQQMYFLLFVIMIILVVIILQQFSNQKMKKLSVTDPLSGLFNRRYIFTHIHKLLSALNPEKGRLALILFDIDDFKNINDQYGHPAGDYVIKTIAELGNKVFRGNDVFARIGGEEFLCVLPRTNIEEAKEVAERLLSSVSKHSFNYSTEAIMKLTISIGLASYSSSCQSYNEIYSQADNALYKAKSKGKNCIVVAK